MSQFINRNTIELSVAEAEAAERAEREAKGGYEYYLDTLNPLKRYPKLHEPLDKPVKTILDVIVVKKKPKASRLSKRRARKKAKIMAES